MGDGEVTEDLVECTCLIGFIKPVWRYAARLAEHFIAFSQGDLINSTIQKHKC